jgi:hypothetical protein
VAGLLHTPQALVRRARISAGWTLIAGYWLYVVLMAALAWQVQGFFPTEDAPGKNGGLFGAAILLVIGTPLFAVGSGAVFREEPDTTTPRLREHIAAVTILCCTLTGLVAGLTFGYNFALPRNGFAAMFLPGGALWGLLAGAALGNACRCAAHEFGEQQAQDDRRREVLRPHVDGHAGVLPVRLPTGFLPADVGDGGGRSPGAVRVVRGGGAR